MINFWANKKVFITGHTGFKGAWLATALLMKGAKVHGYALPPASKDGIFSANKLSAKFESSEYDDILNFQVLKRAIDTCKPEVVFHLAAQPLVRAGYKDPVTTFQTNVQGVVNLLEAVRQSNFVKLIINVTTDKCYQNTESIWPYRESDPLGGNDPYSASKACSEIITHAYRHSFLSEKKVSVVTARAGNVIGGGDSSADRLIPDFFRAKKSNERLWIRCPNATRPWQHVIDSVNAYMKLAEFKYDRLEDDYTEWNFGPPPNERKSVRWVVEHLSEIMNYHNISYGESAFVAEASLLTLDSSRANQILNWTTQINTADAIKLACDWNEAYESGLDMLKYTEKQIEKNWRH